jgi:hypothetical protein
MIMNESLLGQEVNGAWKHGEKPVDCLHFLIGRRVELDHYAHAKEMGHGMLRKHVLHCSILRIVSFIREESEGDHLFGVLETFTQLHPCRPNPGIEIDALDQAGCGC